MPSNEQQSCCGPNFSGLRLSIFELYGTGNRVECFDLLDSRNALPIREANERVVVGASELRIFSEQECIEALDIAFGARVSVETDSNANSSRSHAFIIIKSDESGSGDIKERADNGLKSKSHTLLRLVDLAGNERWEVELHTVHKQSLLRLSLIYAITLHIIKNHLSIHK